MNSNRDHIEFTVKQSCDGGSQPGQREGLSGSYFAHNRTSRPWNWRSTLTLCGVALLLLSLFAPRASAQGALTNGAHHDATLALGETNVWTFDAEAGDTVLLRSARLSGTSFFVPWIRLDNPDGVLVAAGTSDVDNSVSTMVTNSGTFTVRISSYNSGYSGPYRLHLVKIPGSFTVSPGDEGGPMVNGATYQGTNDLGDLDAWTFDANAGETILVRAGRVTGNSSFYVAQVRLYGPDGKLLASGSDQPNNEVSIITTNSGTFTAVVGSYHPGGYFGSYRISMARIPGSFTVSPGDEGGPMANGATYQGANDLGDFDVWTFAAGSGETVLVRAGRVSGNSSFYIPWVRLYGPDGALLKSGLVEPDNEVSIVTTNGGNFTAVVSSYYPGNYFGTYSLRMARIPGSFTVTPGDEGGPMVNGVSYQGTNDLGDMDVWTFAAITGETVLVRAGRVSGNSSFYIPWVRLYGPDGALLASGDIEPGNSVSIVTTNSGTFTAVVGSYYPGGYFGTYTVRMARIPGDFELAPGDEGGPMVNGATYQGTNDLGDLDVWTFAAEPGDSIFLRAGRVSGNSSFYFPWLRLYGPDGVLLGSGTLTADNAVSIVATNSGTFTAVVGSHYDGAYFGTYTLRLARIPGDFIVSPGDEGGPLPNGVQQFGTNSLGDLDQWSFFGTLGDSNVVRFTASGFTADVRLFGPEGTLLRNFTTSTSNALSYVVTNAGAHTLLVRSSSAGGNGNYTVRLSRVPPDLNVPDTQILDEGAPLNVAITAQNPDEPNKMLTFTLVSAPPGVVLTPAGNTNATITWPTTEADGPSTNLIVASVTDVVNGTPFIRTNSFTVIVNEINEPPQLTVPGMQTINELTTLNVSASATDPDIPINALTFSLVNPPVGMTINPNTGAIAWTPTEVQGPSTNVITVVVTDFNPDAVNEQQLSDTNSFTVIVREVNTAPQLTVPGNQTIDELTPLNVSASATDADLPPNPLTFGLINPPAGMTINPNTGAIAWTPTEAQGPSVNTILVVVTDSSPLAVNATQLSTTNSFTVTVREVNTPPQLTVPANQTLDELTPLNVSASATDSDIPANPLTFSLVSPPAGMTINPNTGAIAWTPTEAQGPSTNVITVVVTDTNSAALANQQLSVTNTFTVTVREVNTAPQLTVPGNQTINELTALIVSASATDSDIPANPLTFTLVSPPTGMTINPTTGAIAWTPTEAQGPSTNVITVVVTDTNAAAPASQQLSVTNTFTVTVNEVNHEPLLTVPANQSMDELTPLNVSASATDSDLPANPLTFTLVSPPAGMTINPTTGAIAWTPTEAQGPSTNVITVVVTDTNAAALVNKQLSTTNMFTIIVNEVNVAPILAAIADQTLSFGFLLSVQAEATDADLPANTLTFSLTTAPTGMTINPGSGLLTWTPAQTQVGTHPVAVRVADNGTPSLSATQTFQVTVTGEGSSLAISRMAGNLMQLTITGDIGLDYELLMSTNLTHWSRLLQFNLEVSPYPYIDPSSATTPTRFYRLRRLSQ
ncbi:MAG: putative Ig domain-containing protein [Verrucomicrobia bacterium]|nr:putative Ig domain-containing protein [Verrucomicrobiota bacterium]